ncbi:MAG: helix-turn-helix domain-containing protein [Tissierella sp.]|nr:helix-turn-helix domain-containing protein [Tissierella sp.]
MELNKNINISLERIKDTTKHVHNGIEFLLVIKGSLTMEKGGEVYYLKPNDIILINNREVHLIKGNSDNLAVVLHIDSEFLEDNCNDFLTKYYICNSAREEQQDHEKFKPIRQSLTQIMLLMFKKDFGYELQIMSKIYSLLNHVILNFTISKEGILAGKHNVDVRMDRILSYINENFHEDISLSQLAKDEFISIHYLSKLFKSKVGVNFSDYITELRINHALKELISTDTPINKIALNSGFSNIQSFNREFKKRYKEVPSEYRKKNKVSSPDTNPEVDEVLPQEDNKLSELLKFVMSTEDILSESDILVPNVQIDFSQEIETRKKGGRILRLGRFKELHNHNIREQITEACKELEFEYIHFEEFFLVDDDSVKDSVLYEVTNLYTALEFIVKSNLKPIVKLNIDYFERFNNNREKIEEYIRRSIHNKLIFIKTNYGLKYLSTWSFELGGTNFVDNFEYFEIITGIFKEFNDDIKIGVSLSDNLDLEENDVSLLRLLKDKGIEPDFVSFESDPNKSTLSTDINEPNSWAFENYLRNQILELKIILEDHDLHNTLIYVTNFNTLGGTGFELSGTFFRAALILNTILSIDEPYVNLSYWLSNQAYENTKPGMAAEYRVLSLFINGLVKRPVYFVLQFIDKSGNNLRVISEDMKISKENNAYYIMVSNQYYYNPLYSIRENYFSINRKNIKAIISGIEPGKYIIKKLLLNKDHGGKFELVLNISNTKFIDQEILSSLENTNRPTLTIFERDMSDGYNMDINVSSNAVILYEIKKLNN